MGSRRGGEEESVMNFVPGEEREGKMRIIHKEQVVVICCQVPPPMQSCRVTHVILDDLSIVHFAPNDFHNFQ